MSKRIVIIGAGPGGLASAMLLASAGLEVTVIERLPRVGGRTSTLTVDGFKFDQGPTFFLFPEVLESVFRMCGRDLHREVELMRLEPGYRVAFQGGGHLDATTNLEALKAQVAAMAPEDARSVERYMQDNRRKFEAFRPVLEAPFLKRSDLLKLPLIDLLPLMRPWASVDRDLRRYFQDPRIRLAFSFQSKYLGMSPFKCPSLFTILAFLEYEYGVYHPVGGCGAVSEAMARVAREMGVEIVLEEPVEEILFRGRRAVGVRTSRDRYDCDALVINADFAHAMSRLVPDRLRRRWSNRKLAKKRYSCSTFMMYLGIEGCYDELPHHNVFLADDFQTHLDDNDKRHRLPRNPSFYVQNPCVNDPSLAPPGHSTLYVLVPVTHQHERVDWSRHGARFRAQTLRLLRERGLKDIEDRIRVERICTPDDWASDMSLYKGATFSLAHSLGQMLCFRPGNRFEDLESVYLVGGGTHPGSGLPVIYESAKISCGLLARDFGLRNVWDAPPARLPAFPELARGSA